MIKKDVKDSNIGEDYGKRTLCDCHTRATGVILFTILLKKDYNTLCGDFLFNQMILFKMVNKML